MPIVTKDVFAKAAFDYVIIGGGTSGLVLATRLSENPNLTIGVIEAGVDHADDPAVTIPGMMARNTRNPRYDWEFYTEPQLHAFNRKIQSSRGKGLGGSSMLNNLAVVRPTREEIDAFQKLGNPGWNWENVLSYMKKSEHLYTPPLEPNVAKDYAVVPDPAAHGTDGPISVSFPPYISPIHKDILDSLENLGLPRNPESAAGRNVGSLLVPSSVNPETATRSYAASAYLMPNLQRRNLIVITEAFATKILMIQEDSGLQRAVGVTFVKDGEEIRVDASKEIILSAGTFQTPQLLEVSGIGDARILKKFDIDCKIDLPGVGENMQDHMKVPTIVQVDQKIQSLEILRDPEQLEAQQELYKHQQGILAGIPSSCFAFIPGRVLGNSADVSRWVTLASFESSSPEVFQNTHHSVLRGIKKQYQIMSEWIDKPVHPLAQLLNMNGHFPVPGLTPDPSKRYMTLICAYTHPFSRGTVHVTSPDAQIPPAIQPNYLSNPADLEILSKAVKFTLNLYDTQPLSDLVLAPVAPPFNKDAGAEEVTAYVRQMLSTVHHPVGTASMLPREDGGVVNHELLVYGTSNLRVVDCSIIPLEISSNIVTLAYAIGEKAADIIKGDAA
ncbi:alcohol oxidase [Dendrothele bispora CBS 962.96]|uniref:Alcohol oxidase n=1 Tax=Dendrothele bispora (strain CBS 962.96) TaxID=1314807 RepID=A0A4S8LF33_DENBC|nr:alcohol oxidase [Dendrothele bispora CBS 962.96]